MKFYHLQVKEVVRETADAITIHLWHPLNEVIKYKAGQFITILVPIEGKKVRRSYSMSSSPTADTAIAVTVKRVAGGLVSNWLNDNVKVGDFLEVIEPMGNFFVEPDFNKQRHIVLFAAGSGVTPLMSIAKTVLKSEPNSKVSLIYGNRNEETIIFKKAIAELEAANRARFEVVNILSKPSETWVGGFGHINQAQTVYYTKQLGVQYDEADFYLCGPVGMMDEVIKALHLFNVPSSRIHKENFNAPMVEDDEPAGSEAVETGGSQKVTVRYEGDEHVFEVQPHQTILEAALELDIDLPYSCQAGMCTACLGKCVEGKVKLDEEDGLTEKELAQGFILTCVAHPVGPGVVIDID
jgi:ring-1,2-phenylacetyl-CoA epoxidase subunit PaaE